MADESKQVVARWLKHVWMDGRPEAIGVMSHPNRTSHGLTESSMDLQQLRKFAEQFLKAFRFRSFKIEDSIAEGDRVAVRWVAELTHIGEWLGVAATGREVHTSGLAIIRIQDGKVIESWNNWDAAGLAKQIADSK